MNNVLYNTKLEPVFNGYQYLVVFLLAMFIDLIIHFFSSRKYNAMKNNTSAVGFLPELNVYYKSLGKYGPFKGHDPFYNTCNSWLLGTIITGLMCVSILFVSDVILYASNKYYEN